MFFLFYETTIQKHHHVLNNTEILDTFELNYSRKNSNYLHMAGLLTHFILGSTFPN